MAGRPRSPQQASFFDELKDWSEIKLRILEKYFDAYQRIRGGSQPAIYYIDGFAGAGYYGKNEDDQKEGSPIRLARLAQDCIIQQKSFRLTCLNFEVNPEWFAKLQIALNEFDANVVQATLGSFEQHLPHILATIGRSPAVLFLDPFGPSPLKLSNLQPFLQRQDTELLLNINTSSLRRMAGFEDSTTSSQRNAKLRLVSEILGENPDDPEPEWTRQFRMMDPVDWEYWAVERYMQRMQEISTHIRYTVAYPIREKYRSNPKYFLVFATRSIKAVRVMNDLLCTEEDSLFDRWEAIDSRGQYSIFGLLREAENDDRLRELLDEIHAYGKAHQRCTREDLLNHFVEEQFGQFKQKHYRQAITKLVKAGRARFANGRSNDRDPIIFL